MSSPFRRVSVAVLLLAGLAAAQPRTLSVCADPANLPFSNRAQQGFENRIAELLARDLHATLRYQWQRMGRGFVRDYLAGAQCDLIIGIPTDYKPVLTTSPYYRSSYVFVTRRDRALHDLSLNDAVLHKMKIGVQVLEEDYTPAAEALARRGMQGNIVGFQTTGSQAASIVRAVYGRKIDTAIVWGPLAGYFARRYGNALELTPVEPQVDPPALPFTFQISMGVRKGNGVLASELEKFLLRRRPEIERILHDYGVPQLAMTTSVARKGE